METLTRKEQKEKTRHGLVKHAELLFSKYGISQTTTADVAKALKVSHGTVFVHFPTRDELILAVVEQFGDRLSEALGNCLSEEMPLKELLQAHLAVLADFEDFYLRLITESQFLPARIRGIQYGMNASLSYRFYRQAQKLMKEGEIKKMDQASFFNTWMSLVHYYVMNRDLFSDKSPILQEAGEVAEHGRHLRL
ncbi:MAG: TetR/AcrR family transcriptional regulator, partial [Bdellovibrionota bacterium]